ncbi:MAG: hypothetical protein AAF502_06350 [Bacteroidota bacterium]
MKKTILTLLVAVFIFSECNYPKTETTEKVEIPIPRDTLFAQPSNLLNEYIGFNSPKAIDTLVSIENEYFKRYKSGISKFYGTVWREFAESNSPEDSTTIYQRYLGQLGEKPDSMHCTIYADRALKVGLEDQFDRLETTHRRIWKQREHAGWSVGYILVKEHNWKAYLVLDKASGEYDHCMNAYQRNKSYPVWRQPDIPLEAVFVKGEDNIKIQELLLENEFGWGFSEQGIHTWITRFDVLKECNWSGAPGKAFETSSKPLFIKTPFLEFNDYLSHVIIFPPKE